MTTTTLHTNPDAWKELAQKAQAHSSKAGDTVKAMIAHMNEVSPLSKSSCILDNGCGPGSIISYILDTYGADLPENARLLASDYSKHMLEALNKTKQDRISKGVRLWERLQLLNLDAHDMSSIAADSVTHITGGHLYFLLADPPKALTETHRILAPKGVVAMSSGSASEHLDALQDAVEHVRPGTHLRMIKEPWASETGVREQLTQAGFVGVETFSIESTIQYSDHLDFARTLLLMPVLKNVTADYDDAEQEKLLDQLVQILQEKNPAAPGSLKGTSIVAIARK